jgi:hypothetical protein
LRNDGWFKGPDDQTTADPNGPELASAVVAVALLLMIGVIFAIATARYSEEDLSNFIGSFGAQPRASATVPRR